MVRSFTIEPCCKARAVWCLPLPLSFAVGCVLCGAFPLSLAVRCVPCGAFRVWLWPMLTGRGVFQIMDFSPESVAAFIAVLGLLSIVAQVSAKGVGGDLYLMCLVTACM